MIWCIFNPGACLDGAAQSILSLFPFGAFGAVFTAGLIVGAILGKWGVGALIMMAAAVRIGSRDQRDTHEHVPDGMDAWVPSPKAKPKPVARPKTKRTFNPDTNSWE